MTVRRRKEGKTCHSRQSSSMEAGQPRPIQAQTVSTVPEGLSGETHFTPAQALRGNLVSVSRRKGVVKD